MRRADRLFRIVQRLRRRGVTTAAQLAEALEVSERTVYRDVRDLIASGVPILGEAGVGYALPRGFDLPPLMFTDEELEALVLGARMVQAWADKRLARAAEEALAKIETALPPRLQGRIAEAALMAPGFHVGPGAHAFLEELRTALRLRRKVRFGYADVGGKETARTVRPLGLAYWGRSWSLAGWCELRQDFRSFRLDRLRALSVLEEPFGDEPGKTLKDFLARMERENRERPPKSREP
jgi:predicted DNA-binding transcriptional regulator YafY